MIERCPVGFTALLMRHSNSMGKAAVRPLRGAFGAAVPGIETGGRDLEASAHQAYRKAGRALRNRSVSHWGANPDYVAPDGISALQISLKLPH